MSCHLHAPFCPVSLFFSLYVTYLVPVSYLWALTVASCLLSTTSSHDLYIKFTGCFSLAVLKKKKTLSHWFKPCGLRPGVLYMLSVCCLRYFDSSQSVRTCSSSKIFKCKISNCLPSTSLSLYCLPGTIEVLLIKSKFVLWIFSAVRYLFTSSSFPSNSSDHERPGPSSEAQSLTVVPDYVQWVYPMTLKTLFFSYCDLSYLLWTTIKIGSIEQTQK